MRKIQFNSSDSAKRYLTRYITNLSEIPDHYKNWDLCYFAVNLYGKNLEYVPECLKDIDMCLASCNQDIGAIVFVPIKLFPQIEKYLALK